jgi:putative sterol carrier protein
MKGGKEMVDRDLFMKTLEEQRNKYTDDRVAKHFKGWNKTLQYYFTDVDEYYVIELIDGQPQPLVQKKLENPDIMYSMSTDTFLAMSRKEISGFKAYQQKKLKVKATMQEILKLQKLDKL